MKKGAILITTLWIITILTILSVSVARRSAISIKLTDYYQDKLKAHFIARAGMYKALAIKMQEYQESKNDTIDAFSEDWGSNDNFFKKHAFSAGYYTLSYRANYSGKKDNLYGISDECSRLNINKATAQQIIRLICELGTDEDEAIEIAYSVIDWRDEDDLISQESEFERIVGAENDFYEKQTNAYKCKNAFFETTEELLLVKGVTTDLFYGYTDNKGNFYPGLKKFITIYTQGEININTASEKVLAALFGKDFPDLASKVNEYRKGNDGVLGTSDDRWFSKGPYEVQRGEAGMVEIKNIDDGDWIGNAYGITSEEYALIRKTDLNLITASKVYRVFAEGEVNMVKSYIEAVYDFNEKDKPPKIKYWHQE